MLLRDPNTSSLLSALSTTIIHRPLFLVRQPGVHDAQHVRFWIPAAADLHLPGNPTVALFKPHCTACVYPKHPCLRVSFLMVIGISDHNLGRSVVSLSYHSQNWPQIMTYPTPPNPTTSICTAGAAIHSSISLRISHSTKLRSQQKGMNDEGRHRGWN